MKFFIDTAEIIEIKKYVEQGLCDGVTTNPTLIMKSGRNFEEVTKEILKIVPGPVSVEAISEDAKGMVKEAERFAGWGKNVVVKIPMTAEGLKAVRVLTKKGIKTNVTLVFSANQALLAAKAGATYVSPFIGRLDDQGEEGINLVAEILDIFENYGFKTEVIVASVRHARHVTDAALLGAHIATIPPNVMEKLYRHAKTDEGIDRFLSDWKKAKK
ncbi:fructose-6-phosphate aldolase [Candidatus Woesearchaeota archaeon]|nr:fructose-6-phosphate aldolase [Candidatus Woesearchaeota archaeon]